MLTIGYLTAAFMAFRESDRVGIPRVRAVDLTMILFIAGLIGARAASVFFDGYFMDYVHLCTDPLKVQPQALPNGRLCHTDLDCKNAHVGELCDTKTGLCHPQRDCLRAFKFWYGGLTFYGGLILAFFAGLWYIRRFKLPLLEIADIAGWAIALGLGFGRIGCLLAGCCFGKICHHNYWFCLKFPPYSPAWTHHVKDLHLIPPTALHSLPVYPTQIMHSLSNFAIFAFLYFYLRPRRKFKGQIFLAFVILYAVTRFIIEFFRDDPRGGLWFFSTSQWIGLIALIPAIYFYIRGQKSLQQNQ